MSEQPQPTEQGPDSGPGPERPAQGWTPTPLPGAERASFASRNPADAPNLGPGRTGDAIDRYAPRRSLIPALAALVAVVAAAAIVYTTTRPQPAPAASATPSHSAPARPSPHAGKQFTADRSHANGTWQITDHRWTPGGLDVLIEITLDSGALTPTFDAMPNSGNGYVEAEPSTLTPAFRLDALRPGTTSKGWLFFGTSHETTLIFLGDAYDPQISGIEVPS